MYEYSGSVISDLNIIKYFINMILQDVNNYIRDEELIFDIRLILNELIVNGVLHGNELEKYKKVKLDLEIREDFIKISVEDEGRGIDYDLDQHRNLKWNFAEDCSGRGLILVNGLSDQFTIEDNRVIVVKKYCGN